MKSFMKPLRALVALPILLLATAPAAFAQDDAEADAPANPHAAAFDQETIDAARTAAAGWLALIDEGNYQESWSQAAGAVQDAVTLADWRESLQKIREPLNPLGDRTLLDSRTMTDPPGAPAGEYVFLHFRTPASEDRTVTETVVMLKEGDDWKGVGYFIQGDQGDGQPQGR
jgi:hypothetical protein